MGLESTKHFITTYLVFVAILLFLSLGGIIDFSIGEPPEFSGTAILGDDLAILIEQVKDSSVIGFLVAGTIEIIAMIISVIAFFIMLIFYIASLLLFTIEGQPFINMFLLIFRILVLLELLPYIKNMLHPVVPGSHG